MIEALKEIDVPGLGFRNRQLCERGIGVDESLAGNPRVFVAPELERGPVLVTVEYAVDPKLKGEFVEAMHQYERVRRRDGASRWGIFRDTEVADRYLEIFLVNSWAEHLRQHERQTQADREVEQRLSSYLARDPEVRHLIYSNSIET